MSIHAPATFSQRDIAAMRDADMRADIDMNPDCCPDEERGEWIVDNMNDSEVAEHIDQLRKEADVMISDLYKLRKSARELVRQAELSLDYRPEFRRAIANVVRDAGKY